MKRHARPKEKLRDLRGRTPETIIRAYVKAGNRPIFPYSIKVDLWLSYHFNDWNAISTICRYRHDRLELMRRRDPVNWACEMLKRKAKEQHNERKTET